MRFRIFVRSVLKTESSYGIVSLTKESQVTSEIDLTSMLLLPTATGPCFAAVVGVASRLFGAAGTAAAAAVTRDPLLVDIVGFGGAVEGAMVTDEVGYGSPGWRESCEVLQVRSGTSPTAAKSGRWRNGRPQTAEAG